jgi:putative heme-binding domain-containing protein
MALRNQLMGKGVWKELKPADWTEKDARAIADVCPGAPTPEAAANLLGHIRRYSETGHPLNSYVHHIARFGTPDAGKKVLAFARENRPTDLLHQRDLFRAIQQGMQERGAPLGKEVRGWGEGLTRRLLAAKTPGEYVAGVELAGILRIKGFRDNLLATAVNRKAEEFRRNAALSALAAIDAGALVPTLGKILGDRVEPEGLREHVARLLGNANRPAALSELAKQLPDAPARLQNVIAEELARSRDGAEKLLEAVTKGKASARVLQERIVGLRLAETGLPDLKARLEKLTKGLPKADQKLHDLIAKRRAGFSKAKPSAKRGAKVFTQHCANCHQLGNKGAKVGPQLDGIGNRGLDRLLEDVLDPNRNVDQAFRLTTIYKKNGQLVSGLLLKEEGQVLVLADSKGKEVRVAKKDVDEKKVSQQSPMPANLVDEIPEKDFYDLMAYLLTQRVARESPKRQRKP